MKWFRKKPCWHENRHEEVGDWVEVRDYPSPKQAHTNVCLMEMWVICDDCGMRDQAPARVGWSTKAPGRYPAL